MTTTLQMGSVRLDTAGLENFRQAIEEGEGAYLKVGVLGDYAPRTSEELGTKRKGGKITNPKLGLIHEFGSIKRNIPERSFLRMPLALKLPAAIQEIGSRVQWGTYIAATGVVGTLDLLGNKCIEIIAQAFASNGFGQWAPWSYKYARFRERIQRAVKPRGQRFIGPVRPGMILILTGNLQRSITYAVVKKGAPTTPLTNAF